MLMSESISIAERDGAGSSGRGDPALVSPSRKDLREEAEIGGETRLDLKLRGARESFRFGSGARESRSAASDWLPRKWIPWANTSAF